MCMGQGGYLRCLNCLNFFLYLRFYGFDTRPTILSGAFCCGTLHKKTRIEIQVNFFCFLTSKHQTLIDCLKASRMSNNLLDRNKVNHLERYFKINFLVSIQLLNLVFLLQLITISSILSLAFFTSTPVGSCNKVVLLDAVEVPGIKYK